MVSLKTKSAITLYFGPAVSAYLIILPHSLHLQTPIVQNFSHTQHVAFGFGVIASWLVGYVLMKKW